MMGMLGCLVLVFLPGAWLTFGSPLGRMSWWARLLVGAMLSPIVFVIQFYAVRLLGLGFERTLWLLIAVNLPALYFVWRRWERPVWPERRTLLAVVVVLLVTLASLWPRLGDTQDVVYTGHSWIHADMAYAVADGELRPEEPMLAGVELAYPWAGHVTLAALTWLLDTPLVAGHLGISLFWLLLISGLMMGLAVEFGARGVAAVSAVSLLLFATNFVGSIVGELMPPSGGETPLVEVAVLWGDPRYSPWAFKFLFPNPMPFALGMITALGFLMVRVRTSELTGSMAAVVLLLLVGVGVIYPILAPAALAIVGARLLAELVSAGRGVEVRALVVLVAVLLVSLVVTFVHLDFATAARVAGSIELSRGDQVLSKLVAGLLVCLLLWIGLAVRFRRCWNERRGATIVLALGALASYGLHAVVHIPDWINEYKFIFTLAICLTPFGALALEPVFQKLGRLSVPVLGLVTLVLALPLIQKVYVQPRWGVPPWGRPVLEEPIGRAVLDTSDFDLRLDVAERAAPLCDAVREQTPAETVLVTRGIGFHLPTLTRRHLYYPPDEPEHYGINRTGDYVVRTLRGYDPELLKARRRVMGALFFPGEGGPAAALAEIRALGRPVALVLDVRGGGAEYGKPMGKRHELMREVNRRLAGWLQAQGEGRSIYAGMGYQVWLFD